MPSALARLLSFALVTMLVIPATGMAQVSSGKILGAVVDESAAALPGVTIVVRNLQTGVSRETVTNTRGRFEIPGLQPGRYQVEAELTGFSRFSQGPVTVQVNEEALVNISLKVGQLVRDDQRGRHRARSCRPPRPRSGRSSRRNRSSSCR